MFTDTVGQQSVADAGRLFDADPPVFSQRLLEVRSTRRFNTDDVCVRKSVRDRQRMSRHQAATAHSTHKLRAQPILLFHFLNNFKATNTVPGNHIRVVKGRCPDGAFVLHNFFGHSNTVAGDVIL